MVMAWLLTWFMFAQSTLISYHTEAFVKAEVGCTVNDTKTDKKNLGEIKKSYGKLRKEGLGMLWNVQEYLEI